MWLVDILLVIALGVVATLVSVRFIRDNGWDLVVPLVVSGAAAAILAFGTFEILPGADVANGIALFLGIILTFVYWAILGVTVLVTHGLARSYLATRADGD
jgi:hypothetical protein